MDCINLWTNQLILPSLSRRLFPIACSMTQMYIKINGKSFFTKVFKRTGWQDINFGSWLYTQEITNVCRFWKSMPSLKWKWNVMINVYFLDFFQCFFYFRMQKSWLNDIFSMIRATTKNHLFSEQNLHNSDSILLREDEYAFWSYSFEMESSKQNRDECLWRLQIKTFRRVIQGT